MEKVNGLECWVLQMDSLAMLGLSARRRKRKAWLGASVWSVAGCFLYVHVLENLGGESENGGEKFIWHEAQPLGEWCLEDESPGMRLEDLLLWDLGSLSCALSSSLNPRLSSAVTRCRRSEGDQGSGFVPLWDTVTNTLCREKSNSGKLWVGTTSFIFPFF